MNDLYAEESLLQVILVTGVIGGGAACLAGRAIAQTWRPFWQCRGVHGACSARRCASCISRCSRPLCCRLRLTRVDTLYLIVMGAVAWRMTRAAQMATQYYWLYERTSPLTWRVRSAGEEPTAGNQPNKFYSPR